MSPKPLVRPEACDAEECPVDVVGVVVTVPVFVVELTLDVAVEVVVPDLVAVEVVDIEELPVELVREVEDVEPELVDEVVDKEELEEVVVVLETEELVDDFDVDVVEDCKETITIPVMNG